MFPRVNYIKPIFVSACVTKSARLIKRNLFQNKRNLDSTRKESIKEPVKEKTKYKTIEKATDKMNDVAYRIKAYFPALETSILTDLILPVSKDNPKVSEIASFINTVLPSSRIFNYQGRLIQDESTMPSGAYKVRGATYSLIKGILAGEDSFTCASAGNHSAGMAYAANLLGVKLTVFLPESTPKFKQDIPIQYGAEVIKVKGDLSVALDQARQHYGMFIHPFDDPNVFKGQGSTLFRLADYARETGTVIQNIYLPNGGGGLLAGSCLALNELLECDKTSHYFQNSQLTVCQQEGQEKLVENSGRLEKIVIPRCDLDFEGVAVKENPDRFFSIIDQLHRAGRVNLVSVSKSKILKTLHEFHKRGGFIEPTSAITLAASQEGDANVVLLTGRNCAPNDPRLITAFSNAVSLS